MFNDGYNFGFTYTSMITPHWTKARAADLLADVDTTLAALQRYEDAGLEVPPLLLLNAKRLTHQVDEVLALYE